MKNYSLLFICATLFFTQCSKKDVTDIIGQNILNNKDVGASANDILSASKYQSIVVEVLNMPGYAPSTNALNNMVAYLNTLVNKPEGITITQKQIAASGKTSLTLAEITDIEKANRTEYTTGSKLAISLIYTDGVYSQNNVLGIAYKNTSMAVFGKTIYDNSGGLFQVSRANLEATIYEHELGHLMGLVDIGSPMQTAHKDAAHGAHCNNSNCLMYYQSETTDVLGLLLGGVVPPLDANCRADLSANGGK